MTNKLKLYIVKVAGKNKYFDNKVLAKQFRDEHPGTVVSRGPDNKNYKGEK